MAVRRKKISKLLKKKLFILQKGKCFYCRIPFAHESEAVGEHKIPLSRGGDNHKENFVLSCYKCDRLKGNRTIHEFKPELANVKLRYDIPIKKLFKKVRRIVKSQKVVLKKNPVIKKTWGRKKSWRDMHLEDLRAYTQEREKRIQRFNRSFHHDSLKGYYRAEGGRQRPLPISEWD